MIYLLYKLTYNSSYSNLVNYYRWSFMFNIWATSMCYLLFNHACTFFFIGELKIENGLCVWYSKIVHKHF